MSRRGLWLLAFVASCAEAPSSALLTPAALDGGPGPGDGGVDAGPDGGQQDAGPQGVARRLVRWSPLGTLPVENLVMNPGLDVLSSLAPMGQSELRRYHWARTPAGQPVLHISVQDTVIVPVQSRPGGVQAEVWLGRREAQPDLRAAASLVGMQRAPGLPQVSVGLAPTGDERALDGVVWRRLGLETTAELKGQ